MKKGLLVLPTLENMSEIYDGVTSDMPLTKGSFSNVQFIFKNNAVTILHNGVDLKEFDMVWLSSFWGTRDLAYAVKLYLDHYNVKSTYVEESSSKISDQVKFALEGLATPDTFFINKSDIRVSIEIIEDTCNYPLVVKDIRGSKGKYSKIVTNRAELFETYDTLPSNRKYFFQSYIENDYDWGILVADQKVVSGEMSYPMEGEFRNNTCNGATEVFVEIDKIPINLKEMALSASKALGLSWSRPDIIISKHNGKAYLLEVNRSPGITSNTSEVSGAQDFLNSFMN